MERCSKTAPRQRQSKYGSEKELREDNINISKRKREVFEGQALQAQAEPTSGGPSTIIKLNIALAKLVEKLALKLEMSPESQSDRHRRSMSHLPGGGSSPYHDRALPPLPLSTWSEIPATTDYIGITTSPLFPTPFDRDFSQFLFAKSGIPTGLQVTASRIVKNVVAHRGTENNDQNPPNGPTTSALSTLYRLSPQEATFISTGQGNTIVLEARRGSGRPRSSGRLTKNTTSVSTRRVEKCTAPKSTMHNTPVLKSTIEAEFSGPRRSQPPRAARQRRSEPPKEIFSHLPFQRRREPVIRNPNTVYRVTPRSVFCCKQVDDGNFLAGIHTVARFDTSQFLEELKYALPSLSVQHEACGSKDIDDNTWSDYPTLIGIALSCPTEPSGTAWYGFEGLACGSATLITTQAPPVLSDKEALQTTDECLIRHSGSVEFRCEHHPGWVFTAFKATWQAARNISRQKEEEDYVFNLAKSCEKDNQAPIEQRRFEQARLAARAAAQGIAPAPARVVDMETTERGMFWRDSRELVEQELGW